jgi:plastocyanin
MRAYGFLGALLGGFAIWASPALAATQTVTANTANTFTPSSAIIAKGDTVNWINNGGLHNVHFDDNSYVMPASPSGTAWSVSKTFANAGTYRYYCEIHGSPGGIGMSGTITVSPSPYARPKGASPSNIRLVPAYKPCSSPNMSHGAPLNVGSCGPPVPESNYATVGSPDANGAAANSVGVITFKTVGESPIDPNNGDQADVQITGSITDVRSKANPANDYAGQLRGLATLRITDRSNGPALGDSATTVSVPFPFTMPCATNSDPSIGSSCNVATTADALMAGAVLEGKRAVWGLGRVEVYDGGADGVASTTGDNTLFAHQGLFTP